MTAKHLLIQTPPDTTTRDANGNKATLSWNTSFGRIRTSQYERAQKYVDSEVLRLCAPFVPLLTGMLMDSGTLGTTIGSGLVQYIAPYAHFQYYLARKVGTPTGPLRGPYWFQRMKETHGHKILAGARRIAGGGA